MDPLSSLNDLATAATAVVVAFIAFGVMMHLLKVVVKNPGIPAVIVAVLVGGLIYYAAHGGMSDMGTAWSNFVHTYFVKK